MQEKNTLSVEWRAIGTIRPYPGNPRRITHTAITKVSASISAYGWRQPIVVDEAGEILVGHTRFLAAQHLKLETVPVHIAVGLPADAAKAYRLADNRTHDETSWELPALDLELRALDAIGFDLMLTGFNFDQWPASTTASVKNPDAAPPLPAEPITKLGDLWLLGDHRLLCGDSTDPASVARLLGDAKPGLMATDPPYGVEYDPTWRGKVRQSGKVLNDDRADWQAAWELFPGAVAYVWHASNFAATVQTSLEAAGFGIRSQIIWAKDRLVLSRGHYHWKHEACWYAVRKGCRAAWRGSRRMNTLWEIEGVPKGKLFDAIVRVLGQQGAEDTLWRIPMTVDDGATGHGTQKPVQCMRRPILNNSRPGDAVYDPFLGSGTTLIAAHMEKRRCFGLELDPAYCDVIVKRWETFTGLTARRNPA